MIETIEWVESEERQPDDDTMVLAQAADGEVTPAITEAGKWFDLGVSPEWRMEPPVRWAHLPMGKEG